MVYRLFVLSGYQGKGYGRALLDFAEEEILARESSVRIDASFPARGIYLKRGYRSQLPVKADCPLLLAHSILRPLKQTDVLHNPERKPF